MKKSQSILQFITNYKTELIEYGIDEELETKLRDASDQFLLNTENKKISKDINFQSADQFSNLLNEADEIFERSLVRLSDRIFSRPS